MGNQLFKLLGVGDDDTRFCHFFILMRHRAHIKKKERTALAPAAIVNKYNRIAQVVCNEAEAISFITHTHATTFANTHCN
jgi:hypothetical protein